MFSTVSLQYNWHRVSPHIFKVCNLSFNIWMHLLKCHYHQDTDHIHLWNFPHALGNPSLPFSRLLLTCFLLLLVVSEFWKNGIYNTYLSSLRVWLLLLRIMCFEVYLHCPCTSSLLLFIAEWYSIVGIYPSWFIHLPVDGHLSRFHFGTVMNKVTVNIGLKIFTCPYAFIFLG